MASVRVIRTGTVYLYGAPSFGGVRVANLFSPYDKIISTFFLFNAHDLSMKDNSIYNYIIYKFSEKT